MISAAKFNLEQVLDGYIDDYAEYAAECLQIKDHNTSKVVPFVFNNGQRILHAVAEKQKSEQGFIRILFLKSRRFGGSTYVEGRFYWRASLNFNRNAFIVGHEKESTNTLFEMAKLMQQLNPVAPAEIKNNEKALKFDTKTGSGLKSEYRLATAENVDAGRSQGIHYLHGSEVGFWRDADTLLDGLLQCVPDPPAESEIFLESTANGYGNTFQREVFRAYQEGKYPYYKHTDGKVYAWKDPENDWIIVFIPWFVHQGYERAFDNDAQKQAFQKKINEPVFDPNDMQWVESTSLKLQKKFSLSLEQLHWREWAIENKCRGSERKFQQEYPSTVEEAFLSEGSNIFPAVLCDQIERQCEEPIVTGDIVDAMGKTRIRANVWGKFKVWEKPDPLETYFLCVDSAGGKRRNIGKDPTKKEPDFTCIDVFNHRTGKQSAQWHGHIEYDMIGDLAYMIGRLYGTAPACVELQNHGFTVVAKLKEYGYPMYEARPDQPGWLTNAKTKPLMIDTLYQMARDSGVQIKCLETVSEMRTFVEDNGQLEAESGCKDDRVMTAAMASQMMTLLPKHFQVMRGDKAPFKGFRNFQHRIKPVQEGAYREVYVR